MAPVAEFDGQTYESNRDRERLKAQLSRVRQVMSDYEWHTLSDLSVLTDDPEASVSARLRDLRKVKFGGYVIERQYVSAGLWEYRMLPPDSQLRLAL